MKPVVILVSPKGDLNVGGVARSMQNFGVSELRLVSPRCRLDSMECKQMAMHAYAIIKTAKIFSSLEEAIADLHFSACLSAREADDERPHDELPSFLSALHKNIGANDRWALVFGREEAGLRLEEIALCDRQISIPTVKESTSINLASAVSITLAQLFWQTSKEKLQTQNDFERPLKSQELIFFRRLFQLLEQIQFSNPQNPTLLHDDIRAMYQRLDIRERELRILFGILAGVEKQMGRPYRSAAKVSESLEFLAK